jgi:hypothetical protein
VVEERGWAVTVTTLEELVGAAMERWGLSSSGAPDAVTVLPRGRSPWEELVEIEENCR